MAINPQLPKITRPGISGVLRRERLFKQLDKGRKQPVVWIAGHAGSGKTTLVSSYIEARRLPCLWYQADSGDADIAGFFYYLGLAAKKAAPRFRKPLPLLSPEYLPGLDIFAGKFFENLYQRLRRPFVLVFDNYQEIPPDSRLHELIKKGLLLLPEHINVIIISRTEPLRPFARLRANKKISYLGFDELGFTLNETKALIRTAKRKTVRDSDIKNLHKKVEGWAAGLTLFIERWRTAAFDIASLDLLKENELFDYFANEIFEKADKDIRDFLLRTAFLPKMDPTMAEQVTGDPDAGRKLAYLSRNHYFTERRSLTPPVYQYHALFRDFLVTKAKSSFSSDDLAKFQMTAAETLERSNMIEDAALLLIESRKYGELVRLIGNNAPAMLSQGRHNTLEAWITSIPRTHLSSSPWLLYWLAASKLPFDLVESRSCMEKAYELFKAQDDPAGLYLSWAGVVMTYVYAWSDFKPLDRWIPEMEDLLVRHPKFPSFAVEVQAVTGMFSALMFRRPDHPDFPKWQERVRTLMQAVPDKQYKITIGSMLAITYAVWTGDFVKAEEIIHEVQPAVQSGGIPPLTLITWHMTLARYYWFMNRHEDCLKSVRTGLEIAETNGVHVFDLRLHMEAALGALISCNYAEASERLAKIAALDKSCYTDGALYNYLLYIQSVHLKEFAQAQSHATKSLEFAGKAGAVYPETMYHAAIALTLIEQKRHEEAARHLAAAKEKAFAMNCPYMEYICLVCEARSAFDQGRDKEGFALLREGLALGRGKRKFLSMCTFPPHFLVWMCEKALEAGIEVEYVRELIRKRDLVPSGRLGAVEEWPWPVKIYALGKFQIIKEDRPVVFSGKVQQKPLALLKVLLALGGKDVPEEQLTDILWPDADGDLAHKSFETTLHRLRLLMGNDKAIRLKEGLLSLDPGYCWLDVRAFERAVEEAKAAHHPALVEKIIRLYQGHFLTHDSDKLGAASKRDRLRNKFRHLITNQCEHLEAAGEWNKAIQFLHRGLETDNTAEQFYQHLMICHHKLGLESEVLRTYNQCNSVLNESLGIGPSSKTEKLKAELVRHI
ncbi:MAG TPA: BTAD domain-containing putative transcriptional regulator [Nitrospirota bacterium]